MESELVNFQKQVNLTRFQGQTQGHYESFFLRANHPTRPLAFWVRYTIFSPKDHPERNLGEIWAIFFNGESNEHSVAKREYPLVECLFDTTAFNIRIGDAKLSAGSLQGTIEQGGRSLSWDMSFAGDSPPLLLLPLNLYQGRFPAAKSLVSLPLAHFNGVLSVDGERLEINDWVGSQNHNWGSRHTDLYAWGQVAGFDSHPQSFLEVATATLQVGPLWTPPITLLVLRHNQSEYALTGMAQGLRARGKFRYFTASRTKDIDIEGQIWAPREAFVGLNYYNPPGGNKVCLNSKIAACRLHVMDRTSGKAETLETKHRAAFEILTNDQRHGIAISA
jgi:hypothetical protein